MAENLRKVYEEEHVINPHISIVLAFDLWKTKYKMFMFLEHKLNNLADKGDFGKEYDRLDKKSQKLAKELGY